MANIFLSKSDLESLFWNITEKCIGLDPTLQENASKVRLSWPTDGAPGWKITDDIIFVRINDYDDPITKQRDIQSAPIDDNTTILSQEYTRALEISWSLYGPNSWDNSFLLKNNLYLQSIHDQMANSNIYIVPNISAPIRMPELFSAKWWEHTTMNARFYEYVKIDSTSNFITTPVISTTQRTL